MTSPDRWLRAPQRLEMRDGELHLWRFQVGCERDSFPELWRSLTPDELERVKGGGIRATRFRTVRGVLRDTLARYLGGEPGDIRFRYGPSGKPMLDSRDSSLRFNLSHSREMSLIAICSNLEVGADLESGNRPIRHDAVAARHFSPSEATAIRSMPPAARRRAFFTCWTRKEALLKGDGRGLIFPLIEPCVPITDCGEISLVWNGARWSVHSVAVHPGYTTSVAVKGTVSRMIHWDWCGRTTKPRSPLSRLT